MTAQELADQTGLSLEEAEMVLRRREMVRVAAESGLPEEHPLERRIRLARERLVKAEKKVGVKSYEESK